MEELVKNKKSSRARKSTPVKQRTGLPSRSQGPIKDDDILEIADGMANGAPLPDKRFLEERFPGISASPFLREEVYMRLIHQLRMRGYNNIQIASVMKLSVQTICAYRKKLAKAFEGELADFSILGHVGRSMATYREFQAQASKIMYDKTIKVTPRILAINAGVNCEDRVNQLLKDLGAFDSIKYTPNLANHLDNQDGVTQARTLAAAVASGDLDILDEVLDSDDSGEKDDDEYELSSQDIKLIS